MILVRLLKAILLVFVLTFFVQPAYAAKPTPPVLTPKSVCIDAGHGGSDSGAVNNDLLEKDVNLEVATLLENKLTQNGFKVFMTRSGDQSLSNADRYNYCNSQKASILISIHHNGSTDSAIDYSTALYMKKTDERLAQTVLSAVSHQLLTDSRPISRFASGVLLKANMPATISEGFFLTSSDEYNKIKNEGRLNQEADALLLAVLNYFN